MSCANELTSLAASCAATKKKGGVKKKVWAAPFGAVTFTYDVDGNIDTVTIATTSPATVLTTYEGRRLKNNGAYTGEVGENANTISQALNLVLYAKEQNERDAINALFQSDELIVFIETESGDIEAWGVDTGLLPSALTGGTGTALNDSTGITVTLTGSQDGIATKCKFGATLADDIAYLDALT